MTYSPSLGTWLEADPTGYVDGMNLHANYAAMTGGVDPTGLAVETTQPTTTQPAATQPASTQPATSQPGIPRNIFIQAVQLMISNNETSGIPTRTVYRDSKGIATVGVGHNLEDPAGKKSFQDITGIDPDQAVQDKVTITPEQENDLFKHDLRIAEKDARKNFPNYDTLPDDVKMVIIDLEFNMGSGSVKKFKDFKESINNNDFKQAAWDLMHKNRNPDSPPSKYAIDVKGRAKRNATLLNGASPNTPPATQPDPSP